MFDINNNLIPFLDAVSAVYPDAVSVMRLRISGGADPFENDSGEPSLDGRRPYALSEQIDIVEKLVDQLVVAPAFAVCAIPEQLSALELSGRAPALRTAQGTYDIQVDERALTAATEFQNACRHYLNWLKNDPDPDPDVGPESGPDDGGPSDLDGGGPGEDAHFQDGTGHSGEYGHNLQMDQNELAEEQQSSGLSLGFGSGGV